MKIIRLEARNIKRLSAVEITPEGNVVVIGGANGVGKTSVLDSIKYALAGGRAICELPLRAGQRKGSVTIDLGDFTVTRTFTQRGGSLTITNKDGVPAGSPQAILDKITGKLTFDPLDFIRQTPTVQLDTLRGLVGLDFSKLDAKRVAAYAQRTDAKKRAKELDAQLEGMPAYAEGLPAKEVSVKELLAEYARRQEANRANAGVRAAMDSLEVDAAAVAGQIQERESEIKALAAAHAADRKELERVQAAAVERLEKAQALQREEVDAIDTKAEMVEAEIAKLKDEDEDEILKRIESAENVNAMLRQNAIYDDALVRQDSASQEAESLTKQVDDIDADKRKQLTEAAFPIDGLGFDENAVLFNGVPFAQASSAEQLRVSVAMAAAGNPDLRIMLIRDGSLLDAESLRLISDFATDRDYQIWIERVGDGAEVSVVIEDGMVKAGKDN